ncbi:MAG: HAD family hydrolase [Fimbriimonadaceae bacterium]
MPLSGVVFDFDGLILDTETPEFLAWGQVFVEQGVVLELDEWAKCVGGGNPPWRVDEHLMSLVPGVDLPKAKVRAHEIRDAHLLELDLRPGVLGLLDLLENSGVKFGIASSSRSLWVDGFLQNYGLRDRFEVVRTWDMVGAKKPDPRLYLSACKGLGIDPQFALAFEDSPNGILAGKRAGMRVAAVPNSVTERFDLSLADFRLGSLLEADRAFLAMLSA